ncbi:hypothetical protein [Saccharibacillus sp. JS10]|uniref:hypothetical protein n=1 Tax=Saccharibacillus sp. JS10 TaxID=2950552 RepID=UPI00210E6620|nr:hypothetical protein [Saccharibacillus sp. JS10]MCQ4085931.1 hypothetical protein [Saccharibacillus sp. JS10]
MKRIKPSALTKNNRTPSASTQQSEEYILSEEIISSLPLSFLSPFLRELNDSAKRKLAQFLEFPFARRNSNLFPDTLFSKSMLDLSTKARSNREIRRKLAEGILAQVLPILKFSEPFTVQNFDEHQSEWIQRYGKWHCYWALYLSPAADLHDESEQLRLQRLAEEPAATIELSSISAASTDTDLKPSSSSVAPTSARNEAAEQRRIDKLNRRIEQLEERAKREEERARRAEKEANDSKREATQLQAQIKQEQQEREAQRKQITFLTEERQGFAGRVAEAKRVYKQERIRLEDEYNQTKKLAETLEKRLQAAQEQLSIRKNAIENISIAHEFEFFVREDLRKSGSSILESNQPGDTELRTHMRRTLDLLDALDAYTAGRRLIESSDQELPLQQTILAPSVAESKSEATSTEPVPVSDPESPELDEVGQEEGQAGTFYRRDHGGYIVCEDGESFNITESMVYKHQLQHEAEVWCVPHPDGHGGTQYELSLLFQGDDTFSPVRQYKGYAEQDEQGNWYAVDMNDSDRRYPIHTRDLDIQRPVDGAPCIFNVGEEETLARLARVYRDFSAPDSMPKRDTSLPRPTTSGAGKTKREGRKSKPEPFLPGCTIVVMGGQRKWFEDVVVESGAEYVHENGLRPDLVASDLRRAQALFLLITSTSHRASWESVEAAKAAEIPYFIIQGSKSNLRNLLWENREIILAANRGTEA